MRIYLDNAATTPLAPEVLEAMLPYFKEHYGNPSSIHAEGRKGRTAIEKARRTVAQCLNASIGEIFFTSGGTESNNMALNGAVADLGVQRILSSRLEHHCVGHTLTRLQQTHGTQVEYLPFDEKGHIDLNALETHLKQRDRKTLVSLMHSNNEIGTLLDIKKVGDLCTEHGALFHSDSVQTVSYFPIDLEKLNIHFLTGSSHKFYGPKGVGFLYINSDSQIRPLLEGGSQERNMRPGTENVAGITGLATAMELAYASMDERMAKIRKLNDYLYSALKNRYPEIVFNGDPVGQCHPKVLSVNFPPNEKTDLLVFNLDIAGISASGGSACSSGVESASHVLSALRPDDEGKTVRFSFSHHNTTEELDFLLEQLDGMLG